MSKKVQSLKQGSILSESSYYVVKEVDAQYVWAYMNGDTTKQPIRLGKTYVEDFIKSADFFETEETCNQTEVIQKIMANPRTAMSIYFKKQDEKKKVKDFTAEKAAKIAEIRNAKVSDVEKLLSDLIDNPITQTIPGQMRLIKGYHNGTTDERGRIQFVDMEDKNILKGVDPRTIQYFIANGVKTSVK